MCSFFRPSSHDLTLNATAFVPLHFCLFVFSISISFVSLSLCVPSCLSVPQAHWLLYFPPFCLFAPRFHCLFGFCFSLCLSFCLCVSLSLGPSASSFFSVCFSFSSLIVKKFLFRAEKPKMMSSEFLHYQLFFHFQWAEASKCASKWQAGLLA